MKKVLISCVVALLASLSVSAQTFVEQNHTYSVFNSVDISDNFTVRLIGSDKFAVKIKADERIAPFIVSYIVNESLHISIDRKSIPKEMKKEFRGKAFQNIVLSADIYAPRINSIVLNGKSTLVQEDTLRVDSFSLMLNDEAKIDNLMLKCQTADISLSNSSTLNLHAAVAGNMYVTLANSAEAIIEQKSGTGLVVNASGYSTARTVVDVPKLEVAVSSSAEIVCVGAADEMKISAAGTSSVQAESLNVTEASVEQTGSSKCYMNVSDKIQVNLSGGSMMTFTQAPVIDIVRVVNSTLIKADDPKRK